MGESNLVSSGVQELIARIRDEGVQAGKQEADHLVQEAHKRAADILEQARSEAESMLAKARAEIDRERQAAREALQQAVRDTVLAFKERLTTRFVEEVKGLVGKELRDMDFLRQMILAIAGQATPDEAQNRALELLISNELFPAADDGAQSLRSFIVGLSSQVMQGGIVLKPSGDTKPGIRLRLVGEDLEVDLTDAALTDLLLKHLLPRFRAYVEEESAPPRAASL
jgi:V/A-type H+-transporting ATPase subunit E